MESASWMKLQSVNLIVLETQLEIYACSNVQSITSLTNLGKSFIYNYYNKLCRQYKYDFITNFTRYKASSILNLEYTDRETPFNVSFSVRRCECDSVGACDWRGDRGHCQEDFSFPGLEQIESSSLLSSQKCRDLPQTEIGFWTCDAEQTCSLV